MADTVTESKRRFLEAFPLSLVELISTPSVFRENMPFLADLPYPTAAIVRDLAEFAGYSYGAVRTALSRGRTSGYFDTYEDGGTTRFRYSPFQRSVNDAVKARGTSGDGFTIAVASFGEGESALRREIAGCLGWWGFASIARDAYISGRIDTSGLEAELARIGAERKVLLFPCDPPGAKGFADRLVAAFDLGDRARRLRAFRAAARRFIEREGLDPLERGRRIMYSGPVSHKLFFVEEPPLPAAWLPTSYPLKDVKDAYGALMERHAGDLVAYYSSLCP